MHEHRHEHEQKHVKLHSTEAGNKQLPSYAEMRTLLADAEQRLADSVRKIRSDAVERAVKPSDTAGVRAAARDDQQTEAMARGDDNKSGGVDDTPDLANSSEGDEDACMLCCGCDCEATASARPSVPRCHCQRCHTVRASICLS